MTLNLKRCRATLATALQIQFSMTRIASASIVISVREMSIDSSKRKNGCRWLRASSEAEGRRKAITWSHTRKRCQACNLRCSPSGDRMGKSVGTTRTSVDATGTSVGTTRTSTDGMGTSVRTTRTFGGTTRASVHITGTSGRTACTSVDATSTAVRTTCTSANGLDAPLAGELTVA
jgi:hypothetical protein